MSRQRQPYPTALKWHYPVLIVGAGINGCGLFRDLCLQGIDCLLIDREDFCSGASAAPSRLIHGGIKYLETGEFRLVRESALERNRLLKNAPHYVKPLETVLPVNSWFGGLIASALRFLRLPAKLKDRGAIITEIGLRLYDFHNRQVRALPDHRFLGRKRLKAEMPNLAKHVIAAGLYYEGRITHAERLGLELVLDGLDANPGSAVQTYTTISRHPTSGELLLKSAISDETQTVSADVIVNAGGAWIDKVNAGLGIASQHMGGSKGSHLIVDNPQLVNALKGRMIYFGTADGRINLVYPFLGHALIGSTDIPVNDPDEAVCSEQETDYLIGVIGEIFPDIKITRKQVVLTYCGVRPLPHSDGVDIGSVSRDHHIARDMLPGSGTPVFSLIGGKWTTFRAFSEQATDLVLSLIGRPRNVSTQDIPIGGGRDFPANAETEEAFIENLAASTGRSQDRAQILLSRYGTRAVEVAQSLALVRDRPLATLPRYSSGEIAYICTSELVSRLADLIFRRTEMALSGESTPEAIREVAAIAASALNWDKQRLQAEIAHATAELKRRTVPRPEVRLRAA